MLPIILAIRDENDRNYVEEVYLQNCRKLFKIAYNSLHNYQDSQDCVHDVIVVLIDYLEKYKAWDSHHQINFLVKCCRCIAVNKYKENKDREEQEIEISVIQDVYGSDLADFSQDPSVLAVSEENKQRISNIIEDMDPIYGDILYLKCFLGMKNKDIAERLNLSANLVNVRLKRAKQLLLNTNGDELNDMRTK